MRAVCSIVIRPHGDSACAPAPLAQSCVIIRSARVHVDAARTERGHDGRVPEYSAARLRCCVASGSRSYSARMRCSSGTCACCRKLGCRLCRGKSCGCGRSNGTARPRHSGSRRVGLRRVGTFGRGKGAAGRVSAGLRRCDDVSSQRSGGSFGRRTCQAGVCTARGDTRDSVGCRDRSCTLPCRTECGTGALGALGAVSDSVTIDRCPAYASHVCANPCASLERIDAARTNGCIVSAVMHFIVHWNNAARLAYMRMWCKPGRTHGARACIVGSCLIGRLRMRRTSSLGEEASSRKCAAHACPHSLAHRHCFTIQAGR